MKFQAPVSHSLHIKAAKLQLGFHAFVESSFVEKTSQIGEYGSIRPDPYRALGNQQYLSLLYRHGGISRGTVLKIWVSL